MAALMRQKPQIILTDSTDLGEHISKLGDKIIDVMNAVVDDKSTKEQIDRINQMTGEFRQLVSAVTQENRDQADRVVAAIDDLKSLLKNQKPVVVPAPNVNLSERDVDLSPILTALKALKPKDSKRTINLADFRAIQQDDAPDGNQYFLFEDGEDRWYILQFDTTSNQSRYLFGTGDPSEAWDTKYGNDYYTLNEAKRALRS